MSNQSLSQNLQKIANYWVPPILWCLVIFLFSSHPTGRTSTIDWQDFAVKKLAHIAEYGILASLLYRAFRKTNFNRARSAFYSLLITVGYGMSDEIHQMFTPGREPRARDVIFDTIGALLAVTILWKILPKAPKKLLSWAEKLGVA